MPTSLERLRAAHGQLGGSSLDRLRAVVGAPPPAGPVAPEPSLRELNLRHGAPIPPTVIPGRRTAADVEATVDPRLLEAGRSATTDLLHAERRRWRGGCYRRPAGAPGERGFALAGSRAAYPRRR